jgi:CRP-like cAMP-binding protein
VSEASLARCPVLRDLTREELGTLAMLVESREIRAGSAVFREGDEADELLVIASGTVRLERAREAVGLLPAGEVLGGACISAIGRRACDAIADEDVCVLALSRGAYLRLRADFPSVALRLHEGLLRELASHVRALVEPA